MNSKIKRLTLLSAGLLIAGCQDLNVPNTNSPNAEEALAQPASVETLVGSTFQDIWGFLHQGAFNTVPLIADEFSGTYANNAALELSSEPRPPFNNTSGTDPHDVGRFMWEDLYQAISSSNEGIAAIRRGVRILTGEPTPTDNTSRTWAFAKLMNGIAHGYLALTFDQAFIVSENTDISNISALEFSPYTEVRDSAIAFIDVAIDSLAANNITLPLTWINGQTLTSADLIRIANSFVARFLVYLPRTVEERQNVDWQEVLNRTASGITTNFQVSLQANVLTSSLLSRMQQSGTFSAWGDYKLIGPADVSGRYQQWLATPIQQRTRFVITTPDRRITGPQDQTSCAAVTGTVPAACNGLYFRFRPDNIFRPERGTYHHSHYQWFRNAGRSQTQTWAIMTVDEMNLFRAEAHFFLGNLAEAANEINKSRTRVVRIGTTNHPGLPAVTSAGVPESTTCVPRTDTGACASLYQALVYERMIEGAGLDIMRGYYDSRGFGRLPSGTLLHFPVPGRELSVLGIPVYSFGGVGGPGAAP